LYYIHILHNKRNYYFAPISSPLYQNTTIFKKMQAEKQMKNVLTNEKLKVKKLKMP